ncbi:MAG TPA: sulfotransferase [Lacipirellulaceae bacterium]|nr:sulfotransferase [Lacipirellulaceae bacterium]
MARRPNKKPSRSKPPSVGQRRKAEAKLAALNNAVAGPSIPQYRLDVRIDKAQALWREQKFEEAIWYYERALARNPLNAVLLVDVARAYALRYRFADAERLVDKARTLYPDDAQLQAMLGESYTQIQQFDRAIVCYRRSLELEPASPKRPQILLELAKMYERLHNLESARECAQEVVALAPHFYYARYVLANIDRRAGNLSAAESSWKDLINDRQTPRPICADCHYQLAALRDKAGQFDDAFAELIEAKKTLNGGAILHSDEAWEIGRQSGRTMATLTPELCERWHTTGRELAPFQGGLALLTSHPRSGTTLLEQVLDSHPGAISADELQTMPEMVYLPLGQKAQSPDPIPQVLDRTPLEDLNQVRQTYWSSMEGALREPIGGRILIDKNPELTLLLPLVARVFPEMKVLFALRDPRDVVISCFTQQLPLNPVSVHYLTLEGTVKKYIKMMQAWLKLRGMIRNPWIEIRYEDMVADLEKQSRRVLEFLGLPWDDCVLQYHRRAQQKHVHSPTYEAVTKPVYSSSVGRWRNYAQHLDPYQEMLQPYVEAFGYA